MPHYHATLNAITIQSLPQPLTALLVYAQVLLGLQEMHEGIKHGEQGKQGHRIHRDLKPAKYDCVVWCGVVWCGVVWCGMVWCGVCGVVWCGVVWCGVVWCGVVWCGVVWCGVVWCGVMWCGVVWCGVVCRRRCYQKAMAWMSTHGYR